MSQLDIRIGTLVPVGTAVEHVNQILPHGFESFSLHAWKTLGGADLKAMAGPLLDAMGDRAVLSSIGMFGNVLQDEGVQRDFAACIDAARLFNCDVVSGFAGAIDNRPFDESIPEFKRVWGDLARRAADNGVRIAWETCDMGGSWNNLKWNMAHAPAAWDVMFNELPMSNVGLQWEPCHQLGALVDPIAQLRRLAPTGKIFHVHGKDATIAWDVIRTQGIRGPHRYFWHRTPGFGDTNWTDVISILRLNRFQGAIDIEGWHDPVYKDDLEMTGQVHALNYLRNCRGGPYVPNPR